MNVALPDLTWTYWNHLIEKLQARFYQTFVGDLIWFNSYNYLSTFKSGVLFLICNAWSINFRICLKWTSTLLLLLSVHVSFFFFRSRPFMTFCFIFADYHYKAVLSVFVDPFAHFIGVFDVAFRVQLATVDSVSYQRSRTSYRWWFLFVSGMKTSIFALTYNRWCSN